MLETKELAESTAEGRLSLPCRIRHLMAKVKERASNRRCGERFKRKHTAVPWGPVREGANIIWDSPPQESGNSSEF